MPLNPPEYFEAEDTFQTRYMRRKNSPADDMDQLVEFFLLPENH